ncbi:MAG: hypothetical protein JWQ25_1805 [Daejeonella sp.]|nr:hypothetical protein [Daejeonella sp.]
MILEKVSKYSGLWQLLKICNKIFKIGESLYNVIKFKDEKMNG